MINKSIIVAFAVMLSINLYGQNKDTFFEGSWKAYFGETNSQFQYIELNSDGTGYIGPGTVLQGTEKLLPYFLSEVTDWYVKKNLLTIVKKTKTTEETENPGPELALYLILEKGSDYFIAEPADSEKKKKAEKGEKEEEAFKLTFKRGK